MHKHRNEFSTPNQAKNATTLLTVHGLKRPQVITKFRHFHQPQCGENHSLQMQPKHPLEMVENWPNVSEKKGKNICLG